MRKPTPSWVDAATVVFATEVDWSTVVTACSILGNRRRQLVILYLLTCSTDEWVSLTELARWVTAVTTDSSLEAATGADYHNVRESLRQTHLPRLAEAGAVTYDADRTRLKRGDTLPFLGRVLLQLFVVSTTPESELA